MKKEMKTFILGIVIGATAISATTFAGGMWETIDVLRNSIKVKVNGKNVTDDNFVYNGSTYLPIRAVADILGMEIEYDGDTNTAYLGGKSYAMEFGGEKVGEIDGEIITSEEFEAYKKYIRVTRPEKSETDCISDAKYMIIQNRMLYIEAAKSGVFINKEFEDDYNTQIVNFMNNLGGEASFNQILASQGMNQMLFRRFQELSYLENALIDKLDIVVDDIEVRSYYKLNKELFRYDGLRVKQILIRTHDKQGNPLSESEMENAGKTAEEVHALAVSGTDFDELISAYNQDENAQFYPDGYTFSRGETDANFENAAYALEVDEISPIVTTNAGYHIIKLEEKIEYYPISDNNTFLNAKKAVTREKLYAQIDESLYGLNIEFE